MAKRFIVKTNKYTLDENQIRFSYVLANVLKNYLRTGKLDCKDNHYRVLTYLRRKLDIPGKSYEKLPCTLKKKYPLIPTWAFYKKKKEERISIYENYIETAKMPE